MTKYLFVFAIVFTLSGSAMGDDIFVDLRRSTDATGSSYYVSFSQRSGSITGHAFVTWFAEDRRERLSVEQSFGFYPQRGIGIMGPVPGELRNDAMSNFPDIVQNRVTAQVDYSVWKSSQRAIGRWRTSKYQLISSNCISFLQDVSRVTGLETPAKKKSDRPETYLRRLIENNSFSRAY